VLLADLVADDRPLGLLAGARQVFLLDVARDLVAAIDVEVIKTLDLVNVCFAERPFVDDLRNGMSVPRLELDPRAELRRMVRNRKRPSCNPLVSRMV
jgi:hypothetical protein